MANVGLAVIGVVLLMAGFWAFAASYPIVQELQSTLGQVGRAVDPSVQERYQAAVSTTQFGGFVALVRFILLAVGLAATSHPTGDVVKEVSTPGVRVGGVPLTLQERKLMTICPSCRSPIARAASECPSCGQSMTRADLSSQPSIQDLVESGKLRLEMEQPTGYAVPGVGRQEARGMIEKVFCYYCGTAIPSDATFCRRCGKKQEHPA